MRACRTLVTATSVVLMLTAAPAHAEDPGPLTDLVDAAAQRLQTADPVAASKWLTGGPITDPARVHQVLADVAVAAESAGVSADFATSVFTDQINATEAIQYSRFAGWKLDPATAPTAAPDLAASRALIDDLNREMVAEIAGSWPVLTGPDCVDALTLAKDTVAGQRALDPLYRRALDTATRSYCG
ncbi:MAG TPA: chorismate mutase [Mycobacterium sp.]|nr:chorismate mutase [Mycobacterium sp.]HQE13789.1 chorismate mutase [Mycobacterium sp.]